MFAGSKTVTEGKSSSFEGVGAAGDRKPDMRSKIEKTQRIILASNNYPLLRPSEENNIENCQAKFITIRLSAWFVVLALDQPNAWAGLQIWRQTTGSIPSRSFTACRSLCLQPRYFSVVC